MPTVPAIEEHKIRDDTIHDSVTNQKMPKKAKTSPTEDEVAARSVWEIVWVGHIYFSGTLFVLLAIYCSVNILRLHTFSRLFSRSYFVSLNLCLVLIGLLRPVLLFHEYNFGVNDPYAENLVLRRITAYTLVDLGKCLHHTVWKFQDFSITQILREINFVGSRNAKSSISTHLEALNFDFCAFFTF